MNIRICEKPFLTIQGEGNYVGVPVVFVRFSGCNLNCPGCDTKYHKDGFDYTTEQVIADILELNPLTKGVVFTGGEPLLNQDAIIEIIKGLKPQFSPRHGQVNYDFWWFQIETNGTQDPTKICQAITESLVQFNISPKLGSFNKEAASVPLFEHWYIRNHSFIVKPVVSSEEDMVEVKAIQERLKAHNSQIYLMAEGANREGQEARMETVLNLAIKYGYNFTPRLHVLIWNQKRGV